MKKVILAWTLGMMAFAAAARAFGAPDFDQSSSQPQSAAAPPAAQDVWVSFDRADLSSKRAAKLPLSSPILADSRTALFKVAPAMLPVLSEYMHENFKRCGGFFAYRTKAKALAALAMRAAAESGPYTLDQQAAAAPLVAGVKEANLRATITELAAYNNRFYTSDTGVQAARWLQGRWQEIAASIPGATVTLFHHDGWAQPSVVLTIPGSEKPDEIVVLGGHLDSINGWGDETSRAPGADDNASGIAVLTEAARILAESGFRPKRTIQFMGYAAEEVGLRGSQDIAQSYASAGKKVVGVIQYDMSNFKGSSDDIFLLTDHVDAGLSAFVAKLIDAYVGVKRSTTECGYACSDHASWDAAGYPAAMAFESSFDDMNQALHTDRDTLATSGGDAAHSVPFAKLAVAFAVELAKSSGGARVAAASAPLR